eukprot:757593-Hanusia_phi.AAC.1
MITVGVGGGVGGISTLCFHRLRGGWKLISKCTSNRVLTFGGVGATFDGKITLGRVVPDLHGVVWVRSLQDRWLYSCKALG